LHKLCHLGCFGIAEFSESGDADAQTAIEEQVVFTFLEGAVGTGSSGKTPKADGVVLQAEDVIGGMFGQVAGSALFVTPFNFYVSGGGEDFFASVSCHNIPHDPGLGA